MSLIKVERGIKTPSRDLARLCDAALAANGELASLASPEPASRRQVLAASALAAPAICLGGSAAAGNAEHTDLPAIFRDQLDQCRKLGQTADHAILVPVLAKQLTVIQKIVAHTGKSASQPLLIIASRYAEYAGWLAQERGTDSGALAKHEDNLEQVASNIDLLTKLAHAANDNHTNNTGSAAFDAPAEPPAPAERFDAFLDSLDPAPSDDVRLMLTSQVARLVNDHDQKAADEMRRRHDEPNAAGIHWSNPGASSDGGRDPGGTTEFPYAHHRLPRGTAARR